MSCFWEGNLQALRQKTIYLRRHNIIIPNNMNVEGFAKWVQNYAIPTYGVLCNGQMLTSKQITENLEWVKSYNVKDVYQGYYCSTFDPFLFLIAQLFRVNIEHNYDGALIRYQNMNYGAETIKVSSSKTHFKNEMY